MPILLKHQHELFAREVVAGRSNPDAAELVGLSRVYGSTLAANEEVAARIAELREEQERGRKIAVAMAVQKTGVSKAWVIEKLKQNVERAMQIQPVLDPETGAPTGVYVYEGGVANKALELIGKELGMFTQRVDVTHRQDFSRLDDDELIEHIQRRRQELGLDLVDVTPKLPGPSRH